MDKRIKKYLPMSETAYYIILSLSVPRHGYAIIKYVEALTKGRIVLGSGTIYTTLGKMKKDGIVDVLYDQERKTVYRLSALGKVLLSEEIARIKQVMHDTKEEEGKHERS